VESIKKFNFGSQPISFYSFGTIQDFITLQDAKIFITLRKSFHHTTSQCVVIVKPVNKQQSMQSCCEEIKCLRFIRTWVEEQCDQSKQDKDSIIARKEILKEPKKAITI